ncbi:Tetratricopeptide TPR_2 repeat protein [Desulfofarcimen acetoxidans DSM 771]|uniref:Tetratricopeptide TPR_2 repeat protein n=1 Tax=Desulfofarcimen acetoxidans (strain ATCC 49208 / DSM 771 / KCTC 5769 / VKM B-1644 / 5575) TaxID=485916 RepID=C8W554_DESAS|nr:tetratricopeptide repeat protein [Desulfofarcimen acetoxidans]ACV61406.1 Tetratricopeptide TPR_2 repeat protein [Desulfofarcimen acetoxidans DSM 771]
MCIPISVLTREFEGETLYNQGLSYFKKGSPFSQEGIIALNEAKAIFNRAIDLEPELADVYYMRGVTTLQFVHFYNRPFNKEQEGMFEEALKDFDKALQINEDYSIAYAGFGNAYDRYGSFDEAIGWYNKALEREAEIKSKWGESSLSEIYFSRGRAYHRTLKHCCIQDYEKSLAYSHIYTPMHLANAYIQAGRWADAAAMADKSVEAVAAKEKKAPWDYRAYLIRANCCFRARNYQECVDALRCALEIAPFVDPEILLLLGKAFRLKGCEEEALNYFKRVITTCGDLIEKPNQMKPAYTVYNIRGLVWLELEQYQEAINDFSRTVELAPEYYPHGHTHYKSEGLKNLGLAYLEEGNRQKAGECFQKALAMVEEQGLELAGREINEIDEIKAWI